MALTVSTVVLPLQALFTEFKTLMPNMAVVYSDLDLQTMVTRYRAAAKHKNHADPPEILFGFTRTPVVKTEILNGRGKWTSPELASGQEYKVLFGQITINFAVYFRNMTDLEEFEINWAAYGGIASLKRVYVTIPELSTEPFSYPIDWEDLESIEQQDSDLYKMGLTGNFFLRGPFFTFSRSFSGIKSIELKIADYEQMVMMDPAEIPVSYHRATFLETPDTLVPDVSVTVP